MTDIFLQGPIEEKIACAQDYYKMFRHKLLSDRGIVELSGTLKKAIFESHKEMIKTGITDICRECELNEGGSCCGKGLENRYDGWILIVNLLLGVKLPEKRYDSKGCFFLGEIGCRLLARQVICVNYICRKILDRFEPRRFNALREREGEELNTLFFLHERIKTVLRGALPL
ncbi:MAG TPA: hypothetical protein DDW42_02235 [Desulfobacteraceae bacterium]|nr:hypothetical protein [Desulfobacteraceae bacterium]